jgi:hypothetical protein
MKLLNRLAEVYAKLEFGSLVAKRHSCLDESLGLQEYARGTMSKGTAFSRGGLPGSPQKWEAFFCGVVLGSPWKREAFLWGSKKIPRPKPGDILGISVILRLPFFWFRFWKVC